MTGRRIRRKLDELDRLLNDPDVPMEPARVWSLLAEIAAARHGRGQCRSEPVRETRSRSLRGDQELAVAFRAGDRAVRDAEHAPARQRRPTTRGPRSHTAA